MREEYEAELALALAEGLLSQQDADVLREESGRLHRSPLALLEARRALSSGEVARLRSKLHPPDLDGSTLHPPEPAEAVADPAPGSTANPAPSLSNPVERPGAPAPAAIAAPGPASSPDEEAFPVPSWDRYRPVRFLGKGAMGRVWLAVEVKLLREVALKFVRRDDPGLIRRLLLEGRAQARLNDDRVCTVYEVGEVNGLPFIAMQYVEGEPLSQLVPTLTSEQKALVMREVAFGVHEAHRVGLIHRDIKPSNVMVERSAEGTLRPYVMDFGVARTLDEMATGTVLGTPAYMSPEQARGEVGSLDRRADVYGLGATLYHLLTGRPPFTGDDKLEVLRLVRTASPPSPRALNPDVPEDLEAIALRCLERDRSARYDSARALAEDLDRFLLGDPVRARTGRWYRLRKRLRKHWALVSAGAGALLLIALALGWVALARRDAALREQLARRFTERVERFESLARRSALAPQHDVRKDRAALRRGMAELEEEITQGGERALGPGKYALGRGYLALGDHAKAREALEAAWAQRFREPRVAYALALALGHQYQEELTRAQRIQELDRRQARLEEMRQRYQGPVLAYLKESAGVEEPSADYVAALLSFYEQRYDEALAKLGSIQEAPAWVHEADQLRGDVLQARAFARWERGDLKGQREDVETARKAYQAAAAIARSAPSVRFALARLELTALIGELFGGGDVQPHYERGLAALGPAIEMAPDDAEGWVLKAQLHRRLAEHRLKTGGKGKVEEPLEEALRAALEANRLAPSLAAARVELAQVYWQRGALHAEQSKDPREDLRRAAELLEGVGAPARDADYFLGLGLVFKYWADAEHRLGENNALRREKAIDAFEAALRLDEHLPRAWSALGTAYFDRASAPRAKDPDGDLERARVALEKAQALNPRFLPAYYYAGQVSELRARRADARGADPRLDLDEALAQYQKGLAISPSFWALLNGVGTVHLARAEADWDRGRDPFPSLDQARKAFERMLEIDRNQIAAATNLAETVGRWARFRARRGEDPTALTNEALNRFRRAEGLWPDGPIPLINQGLVLLVQARFDLERGRDPRAHLAAATAVTERALTRAAKDIHLWRVRGGVRGIEARWGAKRGRAGSADFEAAARLYEEGLELAPEFWELRWDHAELCLEWAEHLQQAGEDPGAILDRARRMADGVLAARPGWPEALALHAWVLALEAERAPASDRPGLRQRALDELAAALAANANLVPAWWSRREALAQRLAKRPR